MPQHLPTYLPGTLTLRDGTFADYRALGAFHYLAPKPATVAAIVTIDWQPHARRNGGERMQTRPVAVAVLSWPVPSCRARETALDRRSFSRNENLRFANQHIRTISRVIVHPQFRAIGLSTHMIRRICERCNTRYVEAIAAMGKAVPLFTRAGFEAVQESEPNCARLDGRSYFLLDRQQQRATEMTQG